MEEDEPDLETAFKVVAIMQTITEDLDESGKRAWRKMLDISPKTARDQKENLEESSDNQNSDRD